MPDPVSIRPSASTTSGRVAASHIERTLIEPDAPPAPSAETESSQILADALHAVDPATLDRALEAIGRVSGAKVGRRAKTRPTASAGSEPPEGPVLPSVSPRLIKQIAAVAIAVLAFVEPVVTQISERFLSPRTEIADKLDAVILEQKSLQATMVAIAKWTVDVERARRNGEPMPEPPPPVRLILAQDEIARTTGP